jgi:hypothetical protein
MASRFLFKIGKALLTFSMTTSSMSPKFVAVSWIKCAWCKIFF